MLKVGIMMIWSKMTITINASIFIFLSFALFFFDPKIIVLGLETFPTLQTNIHGISHHSLINTMEIILNNANFC